MAPEVFVERLGLVWCEPTTALTDLLLVGLLVVLAWRSRGGGRAYFLLMAAAFLLGAARHLLHHELHDLVPLASRLQNIASSLALGLLASILELGRDRAGRRLVGWTYGGVAGLVILGHLFLDAFWLTVAHQALAQLAVVAVVLVQGRTRRYRWFLLSIALGAVCAVIFAARLAPHSWFNQNDLAHLIMLPAFVAMSLQLSQLHEAGD